MAAADFGFRAVAGWPAAASGLKPLAAAGRTLATADFVWSGLLAAARPRLLRVSEGWEPTDKLAGGLVSAGHGLGHGFVLFFARDARIHNEFCKVHVCLHCLSHGVQVLLDLLIGTSTVSVWNGSLHLFLDTQHATPVHQPAPADPCLCPHLWGLLCPPPPPSWYKGVQCQPSLYDEIPGRAKKISDQCLVPLDTAGREVRLINASCIVDYAVSRRFRTCNEGSQWDW